jgi:hypothetical protein
MPSYFLTSWDVLGTWLPKSLSVFRSLALCSAPWTARWGWRLLQDLLRLRALELWSQEGKAGSVVLSVPLDAGLSPSEAAQTALPAGLIASPSPPHSQGTEVLVV